MRVDRCVEYNGCMNCCTKTMEDPLGGMQYCGKCKKSLWSSVRKCIVHYTLMDGSESRKMVNAIGYSNSRVIVDAGDDDVFVELRALTGKDVVIVNAAR